MKNKKRILMGIVAAAALVLFLTGCDSGGGGGGSPPKPSDPVLEITDAKGNKIPVINKAGISEAAAADVVKKIQEGYDGLVWSQTNDLDGKLKEIHIVAGKEFGADASKGVFEIGDGYTSKEIEDLFALFAVGAIGQMDNPIRMAKEFAEAVFAQIPQTKRAAQQRAASIVFAYALLAPHA